jgi:hypothetical protein
MWKRFALITSVALGCALTVVTCASCQEREGEPFELVTTSPANTFQAHFAERAEIHRSPSAGHGHKEVTLTVLKRNSPIIKDELLYEGGVYDDRFSELFPEHNWVSDSLLRFGRKDIPQSQHDEITVANETGRTLTYLWLRSGKYELFLLFELKPALTVTLRSQAQTDEGQDSSYIGCKGKFDDGKALAEVAANFSIRGKYRGPSHYSVRITEKGVLIASQEFEALP